MKKICTILLLFSAFIADPIMVAQDATAEYIDIMEVGLYSGYRLDQFDWNIAGQNANVLSELEWEDIEIWQLGANGKLAVGNSRAGYLTYIRGSIDYGWIIDGSVRDSDYHGNNRTEEYSRSLSVTEDDSILDTSIGLGFEKKFWRNLVTIGLLGGYSYHEQNLRISTGVQVLSENNDLLGPIPGLNSTYQTKWYGPFAGIDLKLRPMSHFTLFGSVEYHWADYEAEADWNKIDAYAHPVSFRHETDKADGLLVTMKGSYLFRSNWTLDLTFAYLDFSARDGIDKIFWKNSDPVLQKFNEANWQSFVTTMGFTYRF